MGIFTRTIVKVVELTHESIIFEDGTTLSSYHERDCSEYHYLDFEHLSIEDFKDLEFDLSFGYFFEAVPNYGIRLIPTNGHPIAIPGYGENNGYYSANLSLTLIKNNKLLEIFNITNCQTIDN